ncbi:MAG: TAXI family TRAP transporter solute-binding subunit, partial [Beijerinckiaceae bacterium]
LALAALGSAGATAAHAQAVGVATGPQASLTNRMGSAVAKVVADVAGLNARALPHTSTGHAIPLVARGTIAFGMASTGDVNAATTGTEHFKDRKVSADWTIVSRMAPLPVGTIVKKNSPYKTLADLKGKKYPVGFTAHQTVIAILNGFVQNAGMKVSDFQGVPVPNTDSAMQLFLKGSVDGTLSSLGGGRLRTADAKVGGIRILSMNDSPDAIKAMQEAYPNSYLLELKPGKGSVGVDAPTKVMAFDMFVTSSTKTSDETVYKATKALHASRDAMIKMSPVFRAFDPKLMAPQIKGIDFHPGAIRFYKEAGLWNR